MSFSTSAAEPRHVSRETSDDSCTSYPYSSYPWTHPYASDGRNAAGQATSEHERFFPVADVVGSSG